MLFRSVPAMGKSDIKKAERVYDIYAHIHYHTSSSELEAAEVVSF